MFSWVSHNRIQENNPIKYSVYKYTVFCSVPHPAPGEYIYSKHIAAFDYLNVSSMAAVTCNQLILLSGSDSLQQCN